MKKFFKFLLLGAFTLSLGAGFVGCKNYDDEIADICTEIDAMKADIKELQDIIGKGGKTVEDVTGPVDGKLTVKYTNGTTSIITLPIGGSVDGKAPYVVKNSDGSYTLYIVPKDGSDYVSIPIPTAASGVYKIDILGWAAGYDGSGNLAVTSGQQNLFNTTFNVNYAGIDHFREGAATLTGATDESTSTSTGTSDPDAWAGGAHPLTTGVVLNTLTAAKKGIVVEVFPATQDLSTHNFVLKNTKGEELPIDFKTAVPVTGYLNTRAAAGSALYFLPGDYTTDIYSSTNNFQEYTDMYVADTRYALYSGSAKLSEYTAFSFSKSLITSTKEAPVGDIKSANADKETAVKTTYYTVKQGVPYLIDNFASSNLDATANNDAVVDYYLKVADTSQFDQDEFDVTLSADKTQFTVTRLPDYVSIATFDLNVYKLSVKGEVYVETIKIRPVRTAVNFTEALGAYTITDEDTRGTTTASSYVSQTTKISLDDMFTYLATQSYDNTNRRNWFKNANNGATTYEFSKLVIGDKTYTGTDLAAWVTAFDTNGGALRFYSNAGATTEITSYNSTTGTMYSAVSAIFTPVYAFEDAGTNDNGTDTPEGSFPYANDTDTNPDPAFEVGKDYALTIDFLNGQGVFINSLTITFTPQIPALSDMIKRQTSADAPGKWTGDVLNAYYKDPSSWANAGARTRYDIAVGVYNGDTNTGIETAGGDGGFTKLGGVAADKQWADVILAFPTGANAQKINDVTLAAVTAGNPATASVEYALTVTPDATGNNRIFELYYQNDATGAAVNAANSSTTVDLGTSGAEDAYAQALNVIIDQTKYLDVYSYDAADYAANDFQIKIMSALEQGNIKPAVGDAIVMPAAPTGTIWKLTQDKIKGANYNGIEYDLFSFQAKGATQLAIGARPYNYTYVRSVKFEVNPDWYNYYYIVDNATPANNVTTESITTAAGTALGADEWGYLNIKAGSIAGTSKVFIDVTVTDRFGRVKKESVPMTITVQ